MESSSSSSNRAWVFIWSSFAGRVYFMCSGLGWGQPAKTTGEHIWLYHAPAGLFLLLFLNRTSLAQIAEEVSGRHHFDRENTHTHTHTHTKSNIQCSGHWQWTNGETTHAGPKKKKEQINKIEKKKDPGKWWRTTLKTAVSNRNASICWSSSIYIFRLAMKFFFQFSFRNPEKYIKILFSLNINIFQRVNRDWY